MANSCKDSIKPLKSSITLLIIRWYCKISTTYIQTIPQLFNKFYDRVSTINHNLENDPELILILDFCKLFSVVQSVSACRSTGNVMLQTTALVVFAATFALAMNDFKDLTGGFRELCSNWNILSFDEFPS